MAHNLIQSGHRLVVFDLVESAMQDAVSAGAQRAGSPAEVGGVEDKHSCSQNLFDTLCVAPLFFSVTKFQNGHNEFAAALCWGSPVILSVFL